MLDHVLIDRTSASPFNGYDHSLRNRSVLPAGRAAPHLDASLAPFGPLIGVQPIVLRGEHPLVARARGAGIWIDRLSWAVVFALAIGVFARAGWALIQRGGL